MNNLNSSSAPVLKRKVLVFVIAFLLVTGILWLTIGRDIYLDRPATLLSFAIIHFAGYLFFLVMPVEIAFIYFLAHFENLYFLFFMALLTAIKALIINYFCGYLVSKQVIRKFVREEKYEKGKKYILKYGNFTIFIFNFLPLSSPLLILAAGMIKYPLKSVVFYSFLGLLFKYALIVWFLYDKFEL